MSKGGSEQKAGAGWDKNSGQHSGGGSHRKLRASYRKYGTCSGYKKMGRSHSAEADEVN